MAAAAVVVAVAGGGARSVRSGRSMTINSMVSDRARLVQLLEARFKAGRQGGLI